MFTSSFRLRRCERERKRERGNINRSNKPAIYCRLAPSIHPIRTPSRDNDIVSEPTQRNKTAQTFENKGKSRTIMHVAVSTHATPTPAPSPFRRMPATNIPIKSRNAAMGSHVFPPKGREEKCRKKEKWGFQSLFCRSRDDGGEDGGVDDGKDADDDDDEEDDGGFCPVASATNAAGSNPAAFRAPPTSSRTCCVRLCSAVS